MRANKPIAGLRWEPMLFPQDIYGRGSTFSMAGFLSSQQSKVFSTAPLGSLYYGDPGVTKAFTNDKWTNFAPRFGMVWNPRGDGKQTNPRRRRAALRHRAGLLLRARHDQPSVRP